MNSLDWSGWFEVVERRIEQNFDRKSWKRGKSRDSRESREYKTFLRDLKVKTGALGGSRGLKRRVSARERRELSNGTRSPWNLFIGAFLGCATSWQVMATSWGVKPILFHWLDALSHLPDRGKLVPRRGAWQPRILDPELVKSITFAYELRFRRSLYARIAKNMIYNSRLDFIGKFWLYF